MAGKKKATTESGPEEPKSMTKRSSSTVIEKCIGKACVNGDPRTGACNIHSNEYHCRVRQGEPFSCGADKKPRITEEIGAKTSETTVLSSRIEGDPNGIQSVTLVKESLSEMPVNQVKPSCYYEEVKDVNGCAWLTRELESQCGNPCYCSGKKPEGLYHVEDGGLQKVELPVVEHKSNYEEDWDTRKKPSQSTPKSPSVRVKCALCTRFKRQGISQAGTCKYRPGKTLNMYSSRCCNGFIEEGEAPVDNSGIVQPVDVSDATEDLQATNQVDPALVSAGLEDMASVTKDDVKKEMDKKLCGMIKELQKPAADSPMPKILEILDVEPGLSLVQLKKRLEYGGDLQPVMDVLVASGKVKVEKDKGKGYVARYMLTRACLKDRIVNMVKEGVDNYRDLATHLGTDKRSLKPAVRQLVLGGQLRWKEGAYGRLEIPSQEKPCDTCAGHDDKTDGCDICGGSKPLLQGKDCGAHVLKSGKPKNLQKKSAEEKPNKIRDSCWVDNVSCAYVHGSCGYDKMQCLCPEKCTKANARKSSIDYVMVNGQITERVPDTRKEMWVLSCRSCSFDIADDVDMCPINRAPKVKQGTCSNFLPNQCDSCVHLDPETLICEVKKAHPWTMGGKGQESCGRSYHSGKHWEKCPICGTIAYGMLFELRDHIRKEHPEHVGPCRYCNYANPVDKDPVDGGPAVWCGNAYCYHYYRDPIRGIDQVHEDGCFTIATGRGVTSEMVRSFVEEMERKKAEGLCPGCGKLLKSNADMTYGQDGHWHGECSRKYSEAKQAWEKKQKQAKIESKTSVKASIDTCIDKQKPAAVVGKRKPAKERQVYCGDCGRLGTDECVRPNMKLNPDTPGYCVSYQKNSKDEKVLPVDVCIQELESTGIRLKIRPASDCLVCTHHKLKNWDNIIGHLCDGVLLKHNIYTVPCPTPEKRNVKIPTSYLSEPADISEKMPIKKSNTAEAIGNEKSIDVANKKSLKKVSTSIAEKGASATEKKILRPRAPRVKPVPMQQRSIWDFQDEEAET